MPLIYFPTLFLWQSYFSLLFSICHGTQKFKLFNIYMITYSTSVRGKQAYNFFLERVLIYLNKTGHFTKTTLVSWVKDAIFTCIGKNAFDLLKQIANTFNSPVMNSQKCNERSDFFSLCSLSMSNARIL